VSGLSHRIDGGSGVNTPSETSTFSPRGTPRGQRIPSAEAALHQSQWAEPTPLDDNCAKYILSVMVLFLRQAALPKEPAHMLRAARMASQLDYSCGKLREGVNMWGDTWDHADLQDRSIRPQPSFASAGSATKLNARMQFLMKPVFFQKTPKVLVKSLSALNHLVGNTAGQIVHHLSASNWPVVFARVRNRIHHLAGSMEEEPDIVDLELVAHAALDRGRLIQILQGE
jgi:hypothetical protein